MEHLPQLIFDLALLLSAAALATIVCRMLKQPLVLGYVIAGILVGPANGWLPNIVDAENIATWAEIGVIFLMFGLGLEFSVVKLATVGRSAFITALTEMVLMISVGVAAGFLLGWSFYTCLFLGGMLSISSTTIIIKALEELGLMGQKHTRLIFGTLVVEDIIGIFLMVLLSTIAIGSAANGAETALHIGIMILYLIMWFVLSITLIPTVLKKVSQALSDEIVLIVSIALCFCMVVLANVIGFSMALGAFVAGSILAGTMHVHRIEKLFKSVKDLFGAVFFVSVGMLVSPTMIWENIFPIAVITLITLIGKPIFTGLGVIFAGRSLKDAIRTGMSLSQIGEFSFIIAALGVTLGVTADFLFPVIIAVSVITTVTTPFFVKYADTLYDITVKVLPKKFIERMKERRAQPEEPKEKSLLSSFLKEQILRMAMVILAALISVEILAPIIAPLVKMFIPDPFGDMLLALIALLITGVFISNLLGRNERRFVSAVWSADKRNHIPVFVSLFINFIFALFVVFYILFRLEGIESLWLLIPALVITVLLSGWKRLHMRFLQIEALFLGNLNEEILVARRKNQTDRERLSDIVGRFCIVKTRLGHDCQRDTGKFSCDEFAIAHAANLDLLSVIREGVLVEDVEGIDPIGRLGRRALRQNKREQRLSNFKFGDELVYLGTKESVDLYMVSLGAFGSDSADKSSYLSFREYLDDPELNIAGLGVFDVRIGRSSFLRGKTIGAFMTAEEHDYKVLGVERNHLPIVNPGRVFQLLPGDTVWLLGNKEAFRHLPG